VTERDATAKPNVRDAQAGNAGALLRVAREATGMSIDVVAQNLKLAPRQVKALEDGDYAHLPGRTFIRGFVRNYARLVRLDPERVLGALPGGASAPALEAPTLSPTAHTMGELPTTDNPKTSWARWAIPAVLAAIVAAAALYEWLRPASEPNVAARREGSASAPEVRPVPPIVPAGKTGADSGAPNAPAATSLPNPVATSTPAGTPLPNPVSSSAPSGTSLPNPVATSTPAATPLPNPVATSAPTPTTPSETAAAAPIASTSAPQAAAVGEQALVLALRKSAWIEVRDRDGRLIVSKTFPGGTEQTVSGTPPLAIRIGNADEVALRYKGQPVDLGPHTRGNIARLTLK